MHDGVHPGGEHHRLRPHTQVVQHHEHRRGEYSYVDMKSPPLRYYLRNELLLAGKDECLLDN